MRQFVKSGWHPLAGAGLLALSLGASPSALAGANIVVNLSGGGASAVPVAGHGLLIALGVLLMVIAYRFFANNRGYQKLLSALVFTGATLLAAWGAERTVASYLIVPVPAEDPVCGGGEIALTLGTGEPVQIDNECASTPLKVISYENFGLYCLPNQIITQNADVGDVIQPGASALSNYCGPQ